MLIDEICIDDLSDNPEEAFALFEGRLRAALLQAKKEDREKNTSLDYGYTGEYAPERYYVSSIMAFIHEYGLDLDVEDITDYDNSYFEKKFNTFFNKINYARTRFQLSLKKGKLRQSGTPIMIKSSFKEEIASQLNTIRKIVNSNVQDINKKEAIFKKISSLQSEVDRDRTTMDVFLDRMYDLTKVLGRSSDNLEPAVKKLERIMAALNKNIEKTDLLPTQEEQKSLPNPNGDELSDDIPF